MPEHEIKRIKDISGQLGCIQRSLGLILITIIVIPIGFCILPYAIPEIAGSISVSQANYPQAELIYSGYRIYGSSSWQLKSFVYWTNDSIDTVRTFYEKQAEIESFDQPSSEGGIIGGFRGRTNRLLITFADANQSYLGNLLNMYRDDPYSKINSLPRTGTIIIMTHDIFAP